MARTLYTFKKINKDDNTINSSFLDKILSYIFQWYTDSGHEENDLDELNKKYVEQQLTLKADLINFIDKALLPVKKDNKDSVTLQIDSHFANILKDVLDLSYYANFYTYQIHSWSVLDYDIPYKIILTIYPR